MTEMKREKGSLPFYELPPHIKPCSQIIQETRLQLKYSAKIGSDIDPVVTARNIKSPSGDRGDFLVEGIRPMVSRMGNYESEFRSRSVVDGAGDHGVGLGSILTDGVRAVHTKRPFTPRESVDLWGMSARKRPPSAITLSRLSLDEIDSSRPASRTKDVKILSGKGSRRSESTTRYDSIDSALLGPLGNKSSAKHLEETEIELEKTRLRLMALSSLHTTKAVTSEYLKSEENESQNSDVITLEKQCKDRNAQGNESNENYFEKINSLEVAAEYLNTFSESTEKVPKADLIGMLKRVKEIVSLDPPGDPLKARLTKLTFKIVGKNSCDEDVLFWASYILLHCQITGNNLTTVFKMVFKASRSQEYSATIQDYDYLNVFMYSLGEVCPLTQTESLIYGYGTLKFICNEESVLSHVLDLHLVDVMVLHLKIINAEVAQLKKVPETIQNSAFQLTSILRSVVGIETTLTSIAQSGLLEEICKSLDWTLKDIDVISNIVRILSVVSTNDLCCETLSQCQNLSSAVVKILKAWHSKDTIVVRLTYCIGNLLASNDGIRIRLYQEPLALEMIIQVIYFYLENFTEASEDILVKSIRILANWSLCPSIGRELCEVDRVSEILNSLLDADEVSNELLICTISTLHNLSYHKACLKLDPATIKTAESLYNYLNLKDINMRTETMKVLGNLTRISNVGEAAVAHVGTILISLQEDHPELLCATIGVLMNIILQDGAKEEFLRKKGIDYMVALLETKDDVGLNLMICQLLWNLVVPVIHSEENDVERSDVLTQAEMEKVRVKVVSRLGQVETFLTKELPNRKTSSLEYGADARGEIESYEEICLEFVSVAKDLILKLEMLVANFEM